MEACAASLDSQNFIYDKQNKFNYSYPNANFSYVPCSGGGTKQGQDDCRKFTGNSRTRCFDTEANVSSCICHHNIGFEETGASLCPLGSTHPSCVTSFDQGEACSKIATSSLLVFGIASFGLVIFEILLILKTGTVLQGIFSSAGSAKFSATVTCVFWAHLAAWFLLSWSITYPITVFSRSQHMFEGYTMKIGIPLAGVFTIISVLNLSLCWLEMVRMIKKLKSTRRQNIGGYARIFIFAASVIFMSAEFVFFFLMDDHQLGAAFSILYYIVVSGVFPYFVFMFYFCRSF